MIPELSDAENIRILVEQLGVDPLTAEFIVAMERHDHPGDVTGPGGRPLTAKEREAAGLGATILDEP